LKLANCLQHKANDHLLTTFFKTCLIPHLKVATIGMKRKTSIEHEEVAMICEESITNFVTYFGHQASDCLRQKKLEMFEDKPLKPETGTKPVAK